MKNRIWGSWCRRPLVGLRQRDVCTQEIIFHFLKIVFRIDSNRILISFEHNNWNSVFEETKLLERFSGFEPRRRKRAEDFERVPAVSIKSQMLVILHAAQACAVERDGRARKVECTTVAVGNHFDVVGIFGLLTSDRNLQG